MAKFIYRMQNILDLKERLETQAKTEFSEASAKVALEEEKMRELILRKEEYEAQKLEKLSGKVEFVEVRHLTDAIRAMKDLMDKQALAIRVAERERDKARLKLNDAIQERKVQEKLKENAFEEFKLEVNASEIKEIDQLVSFTYNDKKKKE